MGVQRLNHFIFDLVYSILFYVYICLCVCVRVYVCMHMFRFSNTSWPCRIFRLEIIYLIQILNIWQWSYYFSAEQLCCVKYFKTRTQYNLERRRPHLRLRALHDVHDDPPLSPRDRPTHHCWTQASPPPPSGKRGFWYIVWHIFVMTTMFNLFKYSSLEFKLNWEPEKETGTETGIMRGEGERERERYTTERESHCTI